MGSYGHEEIEDHGLLGLVGRELQLSEAQQDGATLRDHLMSHWRQSGERHALLEPIDCAKEIRYLWEYWLNLHRRRGADGAITHQEIKAWSELRRIRLVPFELDALDSMESIYWTITNERLRKHIK